jgi:dipeptidyl aminopeptidase/acylaminoacyl peptidase
MRFDFASQSALAVALQPSDLPDDGGNAHANTTCVGCHALSRDGKRLVASKGASWAGYLVYVNDLSKPKTAADWLTVDGRAAGVAAANRVMTASFNPDGSQFVADAPGGDTLGVNNLSFNDGVTGVRQGTLAAGYPVSFPDWSPDGQTIAVTHMYGNSGTIVQFQEGGISVIRKSASSATGWTSVEEVVVPHTTNKNRYTPNFVPDSSLLLYGESTRQTGDADSLVDGYADPSATVWAVQPQANATPVLLAKANAPGVADKLTLADGRSSLVVQRISSGMLMDTFPRAAPFQAPPNEPKLFWFTSASQRRAGLRLYKANPSVVGDEPTQLLLWMFALDPDQVLAGKDGSYPGFFLPFQDLTTSNHMAAWTQKYVSDNPPPAPPTPPPAPPLTAVPLVPIL